MADAKWWICDECKSLNDLPAKKCYKCRSPRSPQARIVNPVADLGSGQPTRVGVTIKRSQVGELSARDPKERATGSGGLFERYGAQDDEPIESMRATGDAPTTLPSPLREPPRRGIDELGGIHWELGLVEEPRAGQVVRPEGLTPAPSGPGASHAPHPGGVPLPPPGSRPAPPPPWALPPRPLPPRPPMPGAPMPGAPTPGARMPPGAAMPPGAGGPPGPGRPVPPPGWRPPGAMPPGVMPARPAPGAPPPPPGSLPPAGSQRPAGGPPPPRPMPGAPPPGAAMQPGPAMPPDAHVPPESTPPPSASEEAPRPGPVPDEPG